MRVLLTLASSSITGPAERLLGDAEILRAAGHEATVAFDGVRPGNAIAEAEARGFRLVPGLALCREATPARVAGDLWKLRRFLPGGVEAVHAHFSHDHHLALLAAAGTKVKVIRAVEAEANLEPTWARRLAYRKTDGFEVATRARARALAGRFGIAPERIAVLPGAVDAARFTPEGPSSLRERFGLGAGAPVVGIVARMKPERRHRELIAAFGEVLRDVPGATLAVVGRGEEEPVLREAAAGLGEACIFAGYWGGAALPEAYRALDVAVWLADGNDGSARGVLEAMACGVPVVAAAGGAAEEVVTADCGRIVPAGDAGKLARAIGELLARPEERRAMGAAARRRAAGGFTWARRGAALLDFYARIAGSP